ncbi:MAG: T9SS type A sorting domain-containing protein [Candidatus Edwardsbacteria bacterium]|nr:T9SS type A sorting domain-containing protein [Candidatus Edwardsbacteria bacterium]MBU1576022.1 T9SS type A sorting domain-containing protein [Candidatus Edwardsbacteria bacterium]
MPVSVYAQTNKNFTTDGIVIKQAVDSCFVILSNVVGSYDSSFIQLMKVTKAGDSIIWNKGYGGSGGDYGLYLHRTEDNDFVIVGGTTSYGDVMGDVYVIRTDSIGNVIWAKTVGDQFVNCGTHVIETESNDLLVVGYSKTGDTACVQKIYAVKLANNGDTLWTKNFDIGYDSYATCICKTIDGGYIITGDTDTLGNGIQKIFLLKIDTLGNVLWFKTYGEQICGANSIIPEADGTYFVAGYMHSIVDAKTYSYMLKLNSVGDTIWTKQYIDMGYLYHSVKAFDNGYIMAGETRNTSNAFIFKVNSAGDSLLCNQYGGAYNDGSYYIAKTYNNEYNAIGYTNLANWDSVNIMLVRYNDQLSHLSTITYSVNDINISIVAPQINPYLCNNAKMYYGSDYTFQIEIKNNSIVNNAVLYWTPVGNYGTPLSLELTKVNDSIYQYNINKNIIYSQGVSYKIKAFCDYGVYNEYPQNSYYIHPVFHYSVTDTIGYDQWQMISIPYKGNGRYMHNMLVSKFGTYDITKWRLFDHDITNIYHELSSPNTGLIDDGKAYWLRQRVANPAVVSFDTVYTWGPGLSIDTLKLTLASGGYGWNDISLPFLYNVSWADIITANNNDPDIIGPYYYNGVRWLYPNEISNIEPWKGYVVKNAGAVSKNLNIPLIAAGGKSDNTASKSDGMNIYINVNNNRNEFLNVLGTSNNASFGKDKYDYLCPPPSLDNLRAYFIHNDWLPLDVYGCDIRKEIGDGQTWDYLIEGYTGATTISFQLDNIVDNLNYYLIDLTENRRFNLKDSKSYSFIPLSDEKQREFMIIIGSDSYLENMIYRKTPISTKLNTIYPNPARMGKVIINYQLSKSTKVLLNIYNLNGQLVKTIVDDVQYPGYYKKEWNCANNANTKISSGLYFVHLKTDVTAGTKRIILVK